MTQVLRGLLAGVLVLLAVEARAQRLPFTWDVPKVVAVVDVPGTVISEGVPVRMSAVLSAERPEVIGQHLVSRFQAWELHVPKESLQPQLLRETMITALDTRQFISYTAILQANPDGTTTVFMGEANLAQGRKQPQSTVAPMFPGARDSMKADTESARTLTYSVDAKQPEVEAFYRTELGNAGFREEEPRLFRSPNEEIKLSFSPTKEGRLAVVVVRRTVAQEPVSPTAD
ncbi:hypothetical protein [Corallococcus macrosporus]|uniref:Uncharacterized protein n=1 Tax=Corallococcus macrosporus DSM 14697 TaxID=1189310 RepID=A0A250JMT5_9BACT|nr:hypothetical protein [Corallococcus macrosporus]ATB44807.1 hypothetical protein MYMAC_000384 [Corallococcus macrosporus DSM 14697]